MLSCFVVLLCSCDNGLTPSGEKAPADKPTNIIKQAHIYRSSNAEVNIEIFAPLIHNFEGDSAKMEFPQGAKAIFFNKDMSVKSVITADYALQQKPSNDFLLRQNVRIVNYKSEDTIYCEDLIWQKQSQRIYTQKPVRRQSKTGTDYGEGLEANEAMDSVTIVRPHGNQIVEE
ncbi:MAG: LPS export ABC transporter periplasmic protein LptC [Bacteroidales bacterium]|jgi:LPS export ABC transporter protein LptC|nr:LPS export ABC transporter periplasmic protein LptC [Bacteroidales bacterium]